MFKCDLAQLRVAFATLFFSSCLVTFPSCDVASPSTPEWVQEESTESESPQLPTVKSPPVLNGESYTFVAYNIENYLQMWRYAEGGKRKLQGKPEESVKQLLQNIKNTNPDILGICEIGNLKDLEHLQKQLLSVDVNFPYSYHTHGSDSVRKLAILSKYPIKANHKPNIKFSFNGEDQLIRRGIADAYVELPSGKVRCIGIHFKSKRPSKSYDQELLRRKEAFTLRQHLVDISLKSGTEGEDIIVYGDFNDTINSVTLKTVIGSKQSGAYFRPIDLYDDHGLNWTHHWDWQDVYSRFDFILTNQSMFKRLDQDYGYIHDTSLYPDASDHRPLVIQFN